ncbi:sporulation protein YpjB [Paenibacillus herberti]|uniref:Sporulation protein n=1 Tax=Paenibacillus herberti TaxID=1619309 RepID=A0A229P422_9BACL|nr:sporulation protein YpjB [Paenibacillus herberti]OXM16619.1 hypothetical protein CGZ75_08145 [Paenibacillus herberti]
MSRRWWAVVVACLAAALLLNGVAFAAAIRKNPADLVEQDVRSRDKQAQFQAAAERLYDAVMNNERSELFYSLRDVRQLAEDEQLRQSGSELGWIAVDSSVREAQREIEAGGSAHLLLSAASSIRLAADSLTAGNEALWLQYEPVIKEDARQLIIAWTTAGGQGGAAAGARMATLKGHWDLIEPAALLARERDKAEGMRNSIVYSSKLLASQDGTRTGWAVQSFEAVSSAAEDLFRTDTEDDANLPANAIPQPLQPTGGWLLYSIVPLICALLGYVGWINYRRGQHGVTVMPAPAERPSRNGVARK